MEVLDLIRTVVGCVLLGGIVLIFCMAVHQVWAALHGKRTGSEEEYEKRPPCPECGYDLRASGSRCPECGAQVIDRRRYFQALGETWPSNPMGQRRPAIDEMPVEILNTADSMEADLLVQQLNARGMMAKLNTTRQQQMLGAVVRTTEFFHVTVYSGDEETARAFLQRIRGVEDQLEVETAT